MLQRIRRRPAAICCGMPENSAGRIEALRAGFVLCGPPPKSAGRHKTLRGAVKFSGTGPNTLDRRQTLRGTAERCGPSRHSAGRRRNPAVRIEILRAISIFSGTPSNSAPRFETLRSVPDPPSKGGQPTVIAPARSGGLLCGASAEPQLVEPPPDALRPALLRRPGIVLRLPPSPTLRSRYSNTWTKNLRRCRSSPSATHNRQDRRPRRCQTRWSLRRRIRQPPARRRLELAVATEPSR